MILRKPLETVLLRFCLSLSHPTRWRLQLLPQNVRIFASTNGIANNELGCTLRLVMASLFKIEHWEQRMVDVRFGPVRALQSCISRRPKKCPITENHQINLHNATRTRIGGSVRARAAIFSASPDPLRPAAAVGATPLGD